MVGIVPTWWEEKWGKRWASDGVTPKYWPYAIPREYRIPELKVLGQYLIERHSLIN